MEIVFTWPALRDNPLRSVTWDLPYIPRTGETMKIHTAGHGYLVFRVGEVEHKLHEKVKIESFFGWMRRNVIYRSRIVVNLVPVSHVLMTTPQQQVLIIEAERARQLEPAKEPEALSVIDRVLKEE